MSFVMAVPKKKTSKSRRDKRRATHKPKLDRTHRLQRSADGLAGRITCARPAVPTADAKSSPSTSPRPSVTPVRVALDAMGGDHAPDAIIEGAHRVRSIRHRPHAARAARPARRARRRPRSIVHAPAVVEMDEKPAEARAREARQLAVRSLPCRRRGQTPTLPSRPATRARCSRPPCSRSAGCPASCDPQSPCRYPAGRDPSCCSTPVPTQTRGPSTLHSSLTWETLFAEEIVGISNPNVGLALDRRRAREGQPADAGDARAARGRRSHPVRRQCREPVAARAHRRCRRHRWIRGEHGAEAPRGHDHDDAGGPPRRDLRPP